MTEPGAMKTDPTDGEPHLSRWLVVLGCLAWLVMMSPTVLERDAYRYAAGLLAVVGLIYYSRLQLPVRPNWLSWLCVGWGAYAAIRFVTIILATEHHNLGASEWLYIFPFFFPILGEALVLYRRQFPVIIAGFFAVALTMLVVTTDYREIAAGLTSVPLIHNNQIHGAVGCGFMLIGAFYWLLHYADGRAVAARTARFATIAAPLVMLLCLYNIYGAKSKGVWLALVIVLPVLALSAACRIRLDRRHSLLWAVGLIVALAAGAYLVRDNLWATAGPTAMSAAEILDDVSSGEDIGQRVTQAIGSSDVPGSMNARLQIWSNAWEIVSDAPLFGAGNDWMMIWKQTHYASVGFTLMHNGYLEILVRHGIFGLVVFAIILAGFLLMVAKACRAGIVSRSAATCYYVSILYFLVTIASNSNNRLAIGESFFLLTAAVAFYCYGMLERQRLLGLQNPPEMHRPT
jgi:O-antigen ligase